MITGIILAGGQASRMGGQDKGLLMLRGIPLYQHVLTRLAPQVDRVYINANRNQSAYQKSGCRVFSDLPNGFSGPLAGILSSLKVLETEWAVFAPCDVPNLPTDMVARLWHGKQQGYAAYVNDGQREHPTLLLIHRSLTPKLETYLERGDRKLMLFLAEIGATPVLFTDCPLAFQNLNTPDDLSNWQENKHE